MKRTKRLLWLLLAIVLVVVGLRVAVPHVLRVIYPDTYRGEVLAAAEEYDLPPSLIFAVIHTESGFDPAARSKAGAVGLMQITEPTLEWALMRGGEESAVVSLTDPTTNIYVGCWVLKLLGEQFENEDTVLAAYNGGMGHVRTWLADSRYSADGVTLHTIPFKETANYVKKVRFAQKMYQKLYDLP
jgi:soluble lytic murein transglycosylase